MARPREDNWATSLEKIDNEVFRIAVEKADKEISHFAKKLSKDVKIYPTSVTKWSTGEVSPTLKKKHEVLDWIAKNKSV